MRRLEVSCAVGRIYTSLYVLTSYSQTKAEISGHKSDIRYAAAYLQGLH